MPRLHDRSKKSSQFGGSPSVAAASFDSAGVREDADLSAAQVAAILREHASTNEIGSPGLYAATDVVGTTGMPIVVTVPAGKYWRLIGAVVEGNTAAGSQDDQELTLTTRTSADAEIEEIVLDADLDSGETNRYEVLFGIDDYVVGNQGVAAAGTLTVAADVTEDDDMVIAGVTFTFKDALTGAANEILNGADHDATQLALNAAFVDRDNGGVLHTVTDAVFASLGISAIDFAADDMVITAAVKGTAGNSIATTETFTSGSNVFDAATLGTTTAGVDQASSLSTLDYPDAGVYLEPGEDVVLATSDEDVLDDFDLYLFYIEYSADPQP